jgi:hypothetical protein
MKPLWISRPLLNWQDVWRWAEQNRVKKMMGPEELHVTLGTMRDPVDWSLAEPLTDTVEIPAGHKSMQIFGFTVKAIAFGNEAFKERHEELARLYPTMDHAAMLRPHVSLYRGGKMVNEPYLGKLVFGPEVFNEFNEIKARDIKHVKVAGYLVDS